MLFVILLNQLISSTDRVCKTSTYKGKIPGKVSLTKFNSPQLEYCLMNI